jgi:hypothetical protein
MNKSIVTQNPVRLEGYQAVFEPSKYGSCGLMCIVDQSIVDQLDSQRGELLDWCKSKVKNVRRSVMKPEPWEEVSEGQYQLKFKWKPDQPVPIVDSEGTPITEAVPLFSGALVKVAFRQRPYTLPDDSYGTTLKLQAIQVIKASGSAGVDSGDLDAAEAAAMFGQTKGFKVGEPNVEVEDKEVDEDF